jgi:hypothetical protein
VGRAKDHLGRVGSKLRTLPEEGIQRGTKAVHKAAIAALVDEFGPDRKLSGLRNGRPQTIRITRRSTGQLVEGRVMAGPRDQRGPLFWREEGTRSGRRGTKVGRFDGARSFRGYHPGTPASRWWSRAVGEALPEVRAEFDRLYREALRG